MAGLQKRSAQETANMLAPKVAGKRPTAGNRCRAEVTEVKRIEPNYTISGSARPMITFKNPDDDQHYFDGLRRAGLPE
jgi:hypothetical protein